MINSLLKHNMFSSPYQISYYIKRNKISKTHLEEENKKQVHINLSYNKFHFLSFVSLHFISLFQYISKQLQPQIPIFQTNHIFGL